MRAMRHRDEVEEGRAYKGEILLIDEVLSDRHGVVNVEDHVPPTSRHVQLYGV